MSTLTSGSQRSCSFGPVAQVMTELVHAGGSEGVGRIDREVDHGINMILEIATDARQFGDSLYARSVQVVRVTDSRQEQDLWSPESTSRDKNLIQSKGSIDFVLLQVLDSDGPAIGIKEYTSHMSEGDDMQIPAASDRIQVSLSRRDSSSLRFDGLDTIESLLRRSVVVANQIAAQFRCLQKRRQENGIEFLVTDWKRSPHPVIG